MAAKARDILGTLSVSELKALAMELRIDTKDSKSKTDFVAKLEASKQARARLASPELQVRPILAAKTVPALRALAAELRIDVRGCETKADHVARIAAHRAAAKLLETPPAKAPEPIPKEPVPGPKLKSGPASAASVPQASSPPPKPSSPIATPPKPLRAKSTPSPPSVPARPDLAYPEADKSGPPSTSVPQAPSPPSKPSPPIVTSPKRSRAKPAPPPPPVPTRPDLAHPEADTLVLQGRSQDVDFGLVEDILGQARLRFEERDFDSTLELAREALLLADGTLDAFEKAVWAYALLAAQGLIEESGRVGQDVGPAATLLRDAKVAFVSGNLAANRLLLARLRDATKALYSEEVQRQREMMSAAREKIQEGAHVGADVAAAQESLSRARDAMKRAEHARSGEIATEAERLAAESLATRMKEIEAAIPAIAKTIEEARNVGTDVKEASGLLEKARLAMRQREYVLAGELVQRAERSVLQGQHHQIQRAMALRMHQIEKAQGLVRYLEPIVDEGAAFGFATAQPQRLLAEARNALDQGDYVNGTTLAKQADEATRAIAPRLVEERAKRGIATPSAGRCNTCRSGNVAFLDDGWARCHACGATWRWRLSSGLWDRFRSLLH